MKELLQYVSNLETDPSNGEMKINLGISDAQIVELISHANTDAAVAQYTSDTKRFRDREAFAAWLKKERTIYTLTNAEGKLLGIIWFGEEQMPNIDSPLIPVDQSKYNTTFAIRTYSDARGKGLSQKFMRTCFNHFQQGVNDGSRNGVWLETSLENTPAVSAYKKFGFTQVTNVDAHGKILMVL